MDIRTLPENLSSTLAATREYAALVKAKNELQKNAELYQKVYDFNRKNEKLLANNYSQNEINQILNEANREYEALKKYPLIADYFRKGEMFNDYLTSITKNISDSLEKLMSPTNI